MHRNDTNLPWPKTKGFKVLARSSSDETVSDELH
jgi:hypothetical protein